MFCFMFYMWRGSIVLIDAFSNIILLDLVFWTFLKNIVLNHVILVSVHF